MTGAPEVQRGFRSVFARLLAIMVAMATCLLVAVSAFFWFVVTPSLNEPVTRVYGELAQAKAALGPDLLEARAFEARTGIDVLYRGPKGAWSTSSRIRNMDGLEEVHPRFFIGGRDITILPAPDGGQYAFVARIGRNLGGAHNALLATLLVIMTFVVLTAHVVLRRLLDPLRTLGAGVARLGEGRFEPLPGPVRRDEFGTLTLAFNRMVERLAEMMRAREQLLVDVSHELRSPITRLTVALALLPESEARTRMQADVGEMEAMVGELLERERLQHAESLRKEAMEITALVREIAGAFERQGPGVTVVPHGPVVAAVDPRRFRIVLRNLLENAVKYSQPDSRPVRIALEESRTAVAITVADDGIGIPDGELARVFLPFYRVDRSRSKKTGGYGLGLSICQRIAEAHGGSITAQANAPRGTVFTVTIPKG